MPHEAFASASPSPYNDRSGSGAEQQHHQTVVTTPANASSSGNNAINGSSNDGASISSDDIMNHVFTRKELMDLDPRIEWSTPESLRKGHHACFTFYRVFLDPKVEVEVARFGHPDDFLLAPLFTIAYAIHLLVLALIDDVKSPNAVLLVAAGICVLGIFLQWLLCFRLADSSTHEAQNTRTRRHIRLQTALWGVLVVLIFAGRHGTSLCVVDGSTVVEWPYARQCARRFPAFLSLAQIGVATFIRSPPWCISLLLCSLAVEFVAFARSPPASWSDFGYSFGLSAVFALVCAVGNWYRDYAVRWHFASIVTVVAARKEARIQRHDFATIVQFAVPLRLLERLAAGQSSKTSRGLSDWSSNAAVAMTSAVDLGNRSSTRLIMRTLEFMHNAFTAFDAATRRYSVDKVAVYGDCYVVTSGLIGSVVDLTAVCRFVHYQLRTSITTKDGTSNNAAVLHSCICMGAVHGEMSGGSLFYHVRGEAVDRCLTLLRSVPKGTCWVDRTTGQQLPPECEFFAAIPREILPGTYASALLIRIGREVADDNAVRAVDLKSAKFLTRELESKLGIEGLPDPEDVAISQVTLGGNFANPTDEASYKAYAAETVTSRICILYCIMCFISAAFLIIMIVSRTEDASVSYADAIYRDIISYIMLGIVTAVSFWLGFATLWWPFVRRTLRGCCTREAQPADTTEESQPRFTNFSESTDDRAAGGPATDSDHSAMVMPNPKAQSFAKSLALLKSQAVTMDALLGGSLQQVARQLDPFKLPDDSDDESDDEATVSSDHHDNHSGLTTAHKFWMPSLFGARYISKSVDRTIVVWFFLTAMLVGATLSLQRTAVSSSPTFVSGSVGVMSAAFVLRTWRWWSSALITIAIVVIPETIAVWLHVGPGAAALVDSAIYVIVILIAARAGPQRARNAFGLALHVSVSLETVMNNTKQLRHLAAEHVPRHMAEKSLKALRFSHALHKSGKPTERLSRQVDVCEFFGDFVYATVRLIPSKVNLSDSSISRLADRSGGDRSVAQPSTHSSTLVPTFEPSSSPRMAAVENRHRDGGYQSDSSFSAFQLLNAMTSASRNPLSADAGDVSATPIDDASSGPDGASNPMSIVRTLIAQYGAPHITFLQALGDEFCIGGPFEKGDPAIDAAADAVVRCLTALRVAIPTHGFIASGVIEEAAGAIVGAQSLRYRVYGVVARQAHALLDCGLNSLVPDQKHPSPRLLFVTRRLHRLLSASSQTTLSGARWLDGAAKWRTKDTGLAVVHSLVFNSQSSSV